MDSPRKNQLFPDVLATKKKKDQLLKNSKTFCILPWTHMYVVPNGMALPCCVADHTLGLGNVRFKSIKDIWSDGQYKTLRKNMIAEVKSPNCKDCYSHEEAGGSSMRTWANSNFAECINELDNMNFDGSMKTVNWKYFDFRFSNICNFKCRTCNDHFSSSWVEEDNKFNFEEGKKVHALTLQAESDDFPLMPQIKSMLTNMKIINFAGGEPLITPEHYEILEYLIEHKATNVQLKYSTNLSVLKYKSKNIIELWKNFPDILLMASLDANSNRAEYIRSGTVWNNQIQNLKKIKELLPHIKLTFNSVISIFSVMHITDLLDELIEQGIFDHRQEGELSPTLYRLTGPEELNIKVLDASTKLQVEKKITAWIDQHPEATSSIRQGLKDIIDYMQEDWTHLMPKTKKEIDRVDKRRQESFIKTFPELANFYKICGDYNG